MSALTVRAFQAVDLEIRGDGRTLVGLAAPFGEAAVIVEGGRRFTETIAPGAFARTIRERGSKVKLIVQHDHSGRLPVGRATSLREDSAGLVGEFRVSQTQAGDEVLTLVRDGALDGLSIGFMPIKDTWSADYSRRTLNEVRLDEVSVVSFPAYDLARIAAVREAAEPPITLELAYAQLELRKKSDV